MSADLQVRETPDGLLIQVTHPRSWWRMLLGATISAVVAFIFVEHLPHATKFLALAIGAITGIGSGFFEFKARSISTKFNKFEASVVGSFGGGYRPNRHVSLAEISGFTYRPERSGGAIGGNYQPRGLYAELRWNSTCLVPFLDEVQTNLLIDKIYARFPDLPINPDAGKSILFRNDSVTLGLK